MNNCENCIEGRPRIGRLAGVTRTMRLAIFEGEGVPTGTPQDLTSQTVVVRVLLDGTNDIYVPDFVVEGTGNNVIKFVWPANRQAVGNYTIDVTMTDGSDNVNRVNWHGKDGIRLVQYSNQVYGEDATGQESSEAVGLVGYFTTNGVGMSAFDEWRGSEYSEGYPLTVAGFMAYLKQPATDAANAARQQMQQIQSRADEDHTRAGNDHSTAESDHTRAEGDHTTAASDHTTAAADHTAAAADHTQAGNDHTRAEGDHTIAASDHTQAAADHTQAASDHSAAASDHTRAGQDHTRSGSDHDIAVADHAQAEADHTRAESDHGTAAADHTQAGADHSTAAADHTLAASDHSTAAEDHTQALADHEIIEGYDTRLTNVEEDVSQLGQEIDDINDEISESTTKVIPTVHLTGLKLRTAGITAESSSYELNYFPAQAGKAYGISFRNSTGTIRFAYSSQIPAVGVSVTNYKTSSSSEGSRSFTPTEDCYIIVANDVGFGTGDPQVLTAKASGIGLDVKQLKQDVVDINAILDELLIYNEPFDLVDTQINDGSDSRYPAGSLAANQNAKTSLLIPSENVGKIVYSLYAATANSGLAIAFYDSEKVFISGLKSDNTTETTLLSSDFPEGTAYIRISTTVGTGRFAKAYCNKDLLEVSNALSTFKKDTDNGILAPLPVYWAVCGDSIAHANHTAMTLLPADDIYRPIDDYTDKPGYINANSGAYPNYAYHFCKRHRMQWANYGYGGTILGEYIPKYQGENNLLYPFVGTRITQFKEGIPWNYISIMFGWNDNVMGPVYQKDKWLSETYGGDIGYPYTDDLIGTPGFATQAQKDACDALGGAHFFDAFIGTINDTGKDTWYGAWNYALGYLMREYPDAKIMIMCPFIGGTDRTNSQKFRASVKAVAEKFGVACFDFNDLEWWYFTTIMNSTPFANPDRQDGRWVKQNGDTTPATIEGFNRARFCADSAHPTPLGYKWIADPIGYTLLQK